MAQMKIIVNTTDGESVSIDVRPDETYRMLKERIHIDPGIDLDVSQIFYDGKQVDEDQNVYDSFIGDSTLKSSESSNIVCVVEGCPSSKLTHPEKEIFKFPLEAERCSNWLLACNRHDLLGRLSSSLNLEFGVCSSHFPESSFVIGSKEKKLCKGSIPVLFEQPNSFTILEPGMILADVKLEESENLNDQCVDNRSITFIMGDTSDDLQLLSKSDQRAENNSTIKDESNQDEVDEDDLQEDELDELEEEEDEEEEGSDVDESSLDHPGLMCRLCAQIVDDAHFIFTESGQEEKILEKISTSLPIAVHCNDTLPKQVCAECFSSLNMCYNFAMSCVKAEETLKKMGSRFRCKKAIQINEKHLLNGGGDEKSYSTSVNDKVSDDSMSYCYDCPLCCSGSMARHDKVDIDELEGRENKNDPDVVQDFLADSILWVEGDEDPLYLDDEGPDELDNEEMEMCMICGENFSLVNQLLDHSHAHSDGAVNPCSLCGLSFTSREDLLEHLGIHQNLANAPRYKCGDCGRLFSTEARAEFHQEYTHAHGVENNTPLACSECGTVFRFEGNLWDHVRMVHRGENLYGCHACGKTFQIKSRLRGHLRAHAGGVPFECDICSEKFPDQASFKSHEATHSDMKMFQCDQCGRCFSRKYLFTAHVRAHLEKKPRVYTCRICGEDGFESLPKLLIHRRSAHQDVVVPLGAKKDKIHKCDQCNKAFTGRVALKHHMMSHSGELPHVCEYCNKGFTQKRSLMLHRRTHTGEKPYECAECGKRFVQSAHLYSHLRLHTGEKPYQCSECDATFRLKDVRDSHQRKHTGERPFKCKVCDKAFRTSHSYYQHTWIHTGRKPYPCTYCGKAFRRSNGLKVHIRIHTGEKPHECDVCGRGFAQKQDMKKHRNLHTIGKL